MPPQLSSEASKFLPIFRVWADEGSGHPPVALDRPVCVIGRREVGVNLPLQSPQVSKLHALVVREQGRVYLRDLASTNGVQRNGEPVQEVGLSDEDVIRIGSYTLRCDSGFSRDSAAPEADASTEPAPAELRGEGVSFTFPVGQHTVLIGRRSARDVRLDDDDAVAPVHAIVFQLDGKRYVRDLGTPNGTYLNGRSVHQEELKPDDELRVGSVTLKYAVLETKQDEPEIPSLDAADVPDLDEPDVDAMADVEPELAALEESRIALLGESQASGIPIADAPPQEPSAPAPPSVARPAQPEPPLGPSESHIGLHDSLVSIEDSQAPGTPDAGPMDSGVIEPDAPHEPSFHGEVVEFAGDVFAAHPEPAATGSPPVIEPPPPADEPKETVLTPSPLDDVAPPRDETRATPLASHADDVGHEDVDEDKDEDNEDERRDAANRVAAPPEGITQLVEEVAEKAGELKEVWNQYTSERQRDDDSAGASAR